MATRNRGEYRVASPLPRHHYFVTIISSLLLGGALTATAASAQTFPSRPIELVVHTAPGGGTDLIARLVADIMVKEKLVSQPVNVMNRVGGGGAIAYTYVKSKRGDPHVVVSVATLAMLNQVVRPELGLGLENYTPLAFLAQDPQAVMVSVDSPYKTFKDLIEAAKREPNSLVGERCLCRRHGPHADLDARARYRREGQGGREQKRRRCDPAGARRPYAFQPGEHRRRLRLGAGEQDARARGDLAQAAADRAGHTHHEGAGHRYQHRHRPRVRDAGRRAEGGGSLYGGVLRRVYNTRRGKNMPNAISTRTSG